jgi:hypothetical protein
MQEWFNLARDDVVRLRRTPPLVSSFGWLLGSLDHIRALTESFDSKLADAGNPLFQKLGKALVLTKDGLKSLTGNEDMLSRPVEAAPKKAVKSTQRLV